MYQSFIRSLSWLGFVAWAGVGFAQADSDEDLTDTESASEAESARADEDASASGSETVEAVAEIESIVEEPQQTYLFIGARYRLVTIPKFIQNWFADGGQALWAHTPGVEFAIRKDRFEYNIFAQLGFYGFSDVPFKGKPDPNASWELIDSDYKILYLGSDFMWSSPELAPGLSLVYGAGLGIGFVFGDLRRTEAYPAGGDPNDPNSYARCPGPNPVDLVYCETGGHYDAVEPGWGGGGSSPPIFPWIAGQFGVRYKPHRNFVARLELGIMPTGGFLGLAADYGL